MSRLSISDAAGWAGAFLRREWVLLAPVTFAFLALPGLFVQLLVPGPQVASAEVTTLAPWMFWLLPVSLISAAGSLAIVALALVSAISVAEALRLAARRFPTFLAALLLLFVAATLATGVLLMLASFAGALLGAGPMALRNLGTLFAVFVLLAITARILPLPAVVVAGTLGPVAALRRAWALTAGHSWRLFGAVTMLSAAALVVSFAAQRAIAVTAILIGRATGAETVLSPLAGILIAGIGAGISAAFYVLTAAIYRQLAGR